MARPQKYSDEQIIAALKKTRGMVFHAADKLGCTPDAIFKRAKPGTAIRGVIDAERGKVVDSAEMKLVDGIEAGESWAVQLALKTIGKDRGYVERQEHTGKDGGPVQMAIVEELVDANGDR